MAAAALAPPIGRIGPNAITQTCAALAAQLGVRAPQEFLLRAGLAHYVDQLPEAMVEEHEVNRLMRAVVDLLGPAEARAVLAGAGHRTGDYLLAHRIPRAAQVVLGMTPAPLAARFLLSAIDRHAWTFAGSGTFTWRVRRTSATLRIAQCPLCREIRSAAPACDFYAGTFTRLFARLVAPHVRVEETACAATGAPHCEFLVGWAAAPPALRLRTLRAH